jgi:hypothetical protein
MARKNILAKKSSHIAGTLADQMSQFSHFISLGLCSGDAFGNVNFDKAFVGNSHYEIPG